MFINGEWDEAASGATFEVTDPATGATIGTVPAGDAGDAERAIAAAHAAFESWALFPTFSLSLSLSQVCGCCSGIS